MRAKRNSRSTVTESGERTREAQHILIRQDLAAKTEHMSHRDRLFVEEMTAAAKQLGIRQVFTPWQLIWLKDLRKRYL